MTIAPQAATLQKQRDWSQRTAPGGGGISGPHRARSNRPSQEHSRILQSFCDSAITRST